LIVDAQILRRWPDEGRGAQYCDPRRPAFETPLGRDHHRWEWSLLPGESNDEFLLEETAWKLLGERGIGRDDVRIVRQQIYKFESRTAERWRDGRVLLIGDAAHTMPPFMGQGLCAGLRDVANLGWKLDLVLRGVARESLIDTYETERRPHAQTWADISLEVGQISCTTDPVRAAERDAAFARGDAAAPLAFPKLEHGLFADGQPGSIEQVGNLLPQTLIARDGHYGLFDDIVAQRFVVLIGGPFPVAVDSHSHRLVDALGGELIGLSDPTSSNWISDVDGTYYRYLADLGAGGVIIRPDRYVYAAATTTGELTAHLSHLEAALTGSSRADSDAS